MPDIDEDLKTLCQSAKKYGASKASAMSAEQVVVDPRVRLKCMVPVCVSYGVCLTCPPNVPSPEEFSRILSRYQHAVLVQLPFEMDRNFVELVEKKAPLAEIRKDREYQAILTNNFRRLVDALGRLEADAQGMGYRFAVALSGGSCRLCEKCVGQGSGEPCRHPFEARPAMEAVGIDVVETARNAGMPFEFPARDNPVLTGLLLVD
ncbi:MAG: DUF2284 domain-containing protein [Methanomassiliicoccales archaeon]|nr:DUF2284 domain-containing protein [Methanomassiliicoccales archaeon]